jgi:hypothetical protein
MQGTWLLWTGLSCSSCLGQTCHLVDCGGFVEVALVDEAGSAIAAVRGEYREGLQPGTVSSFACDANNAPSAGRVTCKDGKLSLQAARNLDAIDEIRFQLADGTFTEWQEVTLRVREHTDPDFNGPGCSCSWKSATAEPVVVPAQVFAAEPDSFCYSPAELPDSWFEAGAGGAASRECPVAPETSFSIGICYFELGDTALIPGADPDRPCCYAGRVVHCR